MTPSEAANKRLGSYADPIPEKLLSAAEKGKLIAFVGAGASMGCLARNRQPLPSWGNFLSDLVTWASRNNLFDSATIRDMKGLIKSGDYLVLAQECKERLGDDTLGRFIYEVFDPDGISPTRLHELIVVGPFAGYITTNYDNLIERAYGDAFKKQLTVLSLDRFREMLSGGTGVKSLVKLHGDIEDPASIVLAHRDYLRMIWDKRKSRLLKELLTEFSFLFIGCSLTDLDILLALDELAYKGVKCHHFLLSKRGARSGIERKRLWLDRQVEVVEYYDVFGLHNHIDTFIDGLIYATSNEVSLKRVRMPLRRRISVHQTDEAEDDGRFVWKYLFREGAITLSEAAQERQWHVLLDRTRNGFTATDYLIFVTTEGDLAKEYFLQHIDNACAAAVSANVHIVFLVVGACSRPKELTGKRGVFPAFLLKSGFSEVDLAPLRTYLDQDARSGFKQL